MSKGPGPDFGNTVGKLYNIENNAIETSDTYPLNENGYFGEKGKNVRIIKSTNPEITSIDFYTKIGKNGTKTNLPNGKGTKIVLQDGTTIVHRLVASTKGSPVVEITISGSAVVKNQKIHFILRNKLWLMQN